DIVSVATPPNTHKSLAIAAMRAGKHVLVEKPIALNEADAAEIKRVSQQTGRVATVNFVLRFNPIVEILREIVSAGVLGKPRRCDLRNYAMQDTVPEGHWFWNPQISGGIMVEHGVHFFDLAAWALNCRAQNTCSMGADRKPGMRDRVFAAVHYDNDVIGTYWHSFSRPRELETTTFHFAFDLGEIEMVGWIPLELRIWGWTNEPGLDKLRSLRPNQSIEARKMEPVRAHSSDMFYDVEYELNATIKLNDPKLEVYAENLRGIMADLVAAIDDPDHKLRVTLDDAAEAVRVAEMATKGMC
ncbi:MAG: Gfo/Idh/MocA family oxidoreductase, partial [Armatimonadetes bacterium]|nr:Gfo/Idh/MocA family oxidoreductase [Armatimonadota bacterium]